jgi:hypothetical protein
VDLSSVRPHVHIYLPTEILRFLATKNEIPWNNLAASQSLPQVVPDLVVRCFITFFFLQREYPPKRFLVCETTSPVIPGGIEAGRKPLPMSGSRQRE